MTCKKEHLIEEGANDNINHELLELRCRRNGEEPAGWKRWER